MRIGDGSIAAPEPWLEIVEGDSPLLLIAPHGGHAGAAARATLHPKVNDLHTAEITRDLAARLNATALINSAMDRNLIDCNRIPQVAERAPWMLELIADHLARIVDRCGRATVMLIHGWNIIEPRIDFGLGVRRHGEELRPVGSAHVSASDEFIQGPLSSLADKLRGVGITPTYGMRYPAGGVHNLVQAFTERHRESEISSLGKISAIASEGIVDTVQFELSVSVRLPGPLRDLCIDAISETFSPEPQNTAAIDTGISVVRTPRPAARPAPIAAPTRVGIEFYDPDARVGAMASFDLGTPGFGARIMMIVGERRVILCTCEGTTRREPGRLSLGPLSLGVVGEKLVLGYAGPAVVVPDGSTYLSIERALATGILDPDARLRLEVPLASSDFDPSVLFAEKLQDSAVRNATPLFATARGEATLEGRDYSLKASSRTGVSFTGLGSQRFSERRMLWALFDGDTATPQALELRDIDSDDGVDLRTARLLKRGQWLSLSLDDLVIETSAPESLPGRVDAVASSASGGSVRLSGQPVAFVPLSRPGPNGSRIYTSLGFGIFQAGTHSACGMFEYSRRVVASSGSDQDNDTDD